MLLCFPAALHCHFTRIHQTLRENGIDFLLCLELFIFFWVHEEAILKSLFGINELILDVIVLIFFS